MKNRKLFKIIPGVIAIVAIAIILNVVIFEKRSAKNIFVNYSKRIVAELGAFVSRSFMKDPFVNNFSFGPRAKKSPFGEESITKYLKDNFYDRISYINEVNNFDSNPYAKNFQYENLSNEKLEILRRKYNLIKLVLNEPTEFDKILKLSGWVKTMIRRGSPHNVDYNFNALDIMERAEKGENFFCSEYSTVFVQCALSVGFNARYVGLFKGHIVAEAWSDEFVKWFVLDVDSGLFYEKNGIPLDALELHDAYEAKNFNGILALSIFDKKELSNSELEKYLSFYHEFYIRMRNDWFTHKYPHWHHRANSIMNALEWQDKYTKNNILVSRETSNKNEIYFPLNTTSLKVNPVKSSGANLQLTLDSFTPNFSYFLVKIDENEQFIFKGWLYSWDIHGGKNSITISSVNELGVEGPKLKLEFALK